MEMKMSYLEIPSKELAGMAASLSNGLATNPVGLANGFSFDADLKVGKKVPLKITFTDFDIETGELIFELALNSSNKFFAKSIKTILKAFGKIFSKFELPDGVELDGQYIYISTEELASELGLEINVKKVLFESKKMKIYFEVEYD